MKRALSISLVSVAALLVVMLFSLSAFAGPYFVVETSGMTELAPSLVAGWDFDTPFVNWSNMSISGDFYVENDNLVVYSTEWIGGYNFAFAFANTDGRNVFEFGLGMEVELNPVGHWPNSLGLDKWTTSIGFEGYPSDIVTLYAVFDLTFASNNWLIEPTFGLECSWP